MDVAVKNTYHQAKDLYLKALSNSDKRVKDWPLMDVPWPTLGLVLCYLAFVKIGPKVMESRPAFKLRTLMIVYNLGVMFLNLYVAVELSVVSFKLRYSWFCQKVDYSNDPYAVRIAAALWWYYISKLVEFADTLFFVLRKKNNQLTFLHIYHHSTMFGLWWIGVKFVAGGSSFLAAMMNSYVHVLMYSYYGLSAIGPKMQKYLWWKKHITCIQLIQFSGAGVFGLKAIYTGCEFPLWMQYALVAYMLSFIALFGQFYINAYIEKKKVLMTNGVDHIQNGSSKSLLRKEKNDSVAKENGPNPKRLTRAQAKKESKARKDM